VAFQGCTPGYWKQDQHFDSWPSPYTPSTLLKTVFNLTPPGFDYTNLNGTGATNDSMLDALNYQGGSTLRDKAEILLRAATSAVLNAKGLNYPLTVAQIQTAVNSALASGNKDTITNLASTLDGYNNAPCPLN
jgi:hypothetical protein